MISLYGCFENDNHELVGQFFHLPIYKLLAFADTLPYTYWNGQSYGALFNANMAEGETMSDKIDWPSQFFTYASQNGFSNPVGKVVRIFTDSVGQHETGMQMKCVYKDVNDRYGFAVGSLKHGIGLRFFCHDDGSDPVYMMMNPDLSASSDSSSLDAICARLIKKFRSSVQREEYADTVLVTAESIPFAPYKYFNLNDTYRWRPFGTMTDLNEEVVGLEYANAWYLMLKGEHYTKPFTLDLEEPVNGISTIEIATPITVNILDAGRYTATTRGNEAHVETTFTYWEPGTDLAYLFGTARPLSTQTIRTTTAKLVLSTERWKINNINVGASQTTLMFQYRNEWKMKFFMGANVSSLAHDFPGLNHWNYYRVGSGLYLFMSPRFANIAISSWSTKLNDHSNDQWESCPFVFASLMQSYTPKYAKNDFWGDEFMTEEDEEYLGKMFPVIGNNYTGDPLADDGTWVNNFAAVPDPDNNFSETAWRMFINNVLREQDADIVPPGGNLSPNNGGPNNPGNPGGGGTSNVNPGGGGYDNDSDGIDVSNSGRVPDLSNMGNMISCYLMREGGGFHDLSALGNYLGGLTGADWGGVSKLESLVSLNAIMTFGGAEPSSSLSTIVMGGRDTGVNGKKLSSTLIESTVGPIAVPEYFGSFLDYEPYTAIEIYLPFIGMKSLDASEVIGSSLTLVVRQNVMTGTVTYILRINKNGINSARYSWTGDCAIPIPLSATSYAGVIQGIKNGVLQTSGGVTALAGGIASGNPATAVGGGVAMANGIFELATAGQKKHIEHTSGLSGVGGAYACMRPFLSITRPKMSLPTSYVQDKGMPSNISARLGDLTGFTQVDTIHMTGLSGATDEERAEIEELLKTGVIF